MAQRACLWLLVCNGKVSRLVGCHERLITQTITTHSFALAVLCEARRAAELLAFLAPLGTPTITSVSDIHSLLGTTNELTYHLSMYKPSKLVVTSGAMSRRRERLGKVAIVVDCVHSSTGSKVVRFRAHEHPDSSVMHAIHLLHHTNLFNQPSHSPSLTLFVVYIRVHSCSRP